MATSKISRKSCVVFVWIFDNSALWKKGCACCSPDQLSDHLVMRCNIGHFGLPWIVVQLKRERHDNGETLWMMDALWDLNLIACLFFVLQDALEFMSVIAVMVNCALVGFSGLADRLWPDMTTAERIVFIVILEVSWNFYRFRENSFGAYLLFLIRTYNRDRVFFSFCSTWSCSWNWLWLMPYQMYQCGSLRRRQN